MKKYILALTLLLGISNCYAQQTVRDNTWQLVWHDEFETPINWDVWQSEHGFVRNHEAQWYQSENAYTKDGLLILEARKDSVINPRYKECRQCVRWHSTSATTEANWSSVDQGLSRLSHRLRTVHYTSRYHSIT